nr:hypothetical protein [Undibacterium flavidum]
MRQQRPVTIYRLVTQDAIEEKILALHAENASWQIAYWMVVKWLDVLILRLCCAC